MEQPHYYVIDYEFQNNLWNSAWLHKKEHLNVPCMVQSREIKSFSKMKMHHESVSIFLPRQNLCPVVKPSREKASSAFLLFKKHRLWTEASM